MTDVEQNIRFMILEVTKQLENTLECVEHPSEKAMAKVENRDNYIDNMKSVVENVCFSRIHGSEMLGKRQVDRLRATHIIANNLERIGDHAVNIVLQTRYLTDADFLTRYDYRPMFEEIFAALDKVYCALFDQDMAQAFKICLTESALDSMYKVHFDRILNELRAGVETGNLVTTLFIVRYLERIGDALLNIGEAAIFFILGEKFKIRQYQALQDTLRSSGRQVPITDVEFHSIWGTRSGCRIGRVQGRGERDSSQGVIFKEGERTKVIKERDNIARWQQIMPGLPPKVVALHENGNSGSLLIEYLGGCTLQDIVLLSDEEILTAALLLLEQTVLEIWEDTKRDEPVNADYVKQAQSRLEDVFRLYPAFDFPVMRVGKVTIPPLQGLLGEARAISEKLDAPFSVFIHGDFNSNNIVYNHESQRIHYIDLHRSRQTDYIQDLSVFLVSNFRLPVFDRNVRARIEQVVREFYRFGRFFAKENGDETFDARLCLGLARSLLTSTRFELNRKFAKAMFLRGTYLLQKLVAFNNKGLDLRDFTLPLSVLFYF